MCQHLVSVTSGGHVQQNIGEWFVAQEIVRKGLVSPTQATTMRWTRAVRRGRFVEARDDGEASKGAHLSRLHVSTRTIFSAPAARRFISQAPSPAARRFSFTGCERKGSVLVGCFQGFPEHSVDVASLRLHRHRLSAPGARSGFAFPHPFLF